MSEFAWQRGKEYKEIIYETLDGIAKITINRPERRNAFTPLTAVELYDAFTEARDDAAIGVVLLTGANHGGRHEDEAFCSGGDQKKRGTRRICGRRQHSALEYLGRSASHSCDPEAGHRDGEWLLHRWWQRAQHALRPNDRS